MNTDKIFAEQLANEYAPKDTSKVVALRKLDETRCELKRLYVRPAFRGQGLARLLTEQILRDARTIGYRKILLDTLPFLESAIRLYRSLGFTDAPRYNDSPLDTTLFLQLDL